MIKYFAVMLDQSNISEDGKFCAVSALELSEETFSEIHQLDPVKGVYHESWGTWYTHESGCIGAYRNTYAIEEAEYLEEFLKEHKNPQVWTKSGIPDYSCAEHV